MRFATILANLAPLTLALLMQAAGAATLPAETYMQPQRLVALEDGRRINLYCIGHGSPTVLFDAGVSDSMLAWSHVQGEVAKITRACAYDRAGYGFSDPRVGESDAKAIVSDIHALLTAAKIKTPMLYVAHSMAGLYGVLLAARHPEDVAGEVLVDPSFADQYKTMLDAAITAGAPPAVGGAMLAMYQGQSRRLKECAALTAPLPDDCASLDNKLPPDLAAFNKVQESRPSYLLTYASEFDSFLPTKDDKSQDQKELEAAPMSFGDKPLIILTHGIVPQYPGLKPEQSAAIDQAWMRGHDRLATLSSRGSNTVVQGSAHHIEDEQPQAVIDAIRTAIAELRAR